MKKKILIILPIIIIVIAGVWFWKQSQTAPGYYGLPVVACIDTTEPIVQNFSFQLRISINGENVPLDSNIGHDPGQCLRSIYTDNSSGTVLIQSNNQNVYTLEDFFNVWHKNFTATELMGYVVGNGHKITVYVNGLNVNTLETTPLRSGDSIEVIYQ